MITARFLEVWKAPATQMRLRPASLDDLPEIIRRMFLFYPRRASMTALPWMRRLLTSPEHLALIGPNAFGIARIGMFYGCERKASVDILCSRPSVGGSLEALRIVRKLAVWAGRRGLPTLRLDADTGVDFGPFAKRLKAKPVWTVKFEIPTR